MKYFLIFTLLISLGGLTGCSKDREDLKSPCVGTDDSPCGPRKNVNDWWLS